MSVIILLYNELVILDMGIRRGNTMLRKLLSVAIVFVALCTIGTVAYADGEVTTENQEVQNKELEIVGPEDMSTTTDKVIILSGKGKEGTNVIIEVYSTVTISKDTFTLENLPEDDEYILMTSEEFEISSLGSFAKEVELKKGLYKIVFSVKIDDEVKTEGIRYIQVKDVEDAIKALENVGTLTIKPITNVQPPIAK